MAQMPRRKLYFSSAQRQRRRRGATASGAGMARGTSGAAFQRAGGRSSGSIFGA